MAATLIDERQETEEEKQQYTDPSKEAPSEGVTQEAPSSEPTSESTEDDLPEKYRGKSLKDLVQMHKEAEKAFGRQGSEVGELRKIVDDFIQSQLKEAPKEEPEEDIDWYTDPKKAVERAVANHPSVKQAEQTALQGQRQAAMQTLQSKHPDMKDILNDQSFAEWIQKSKVRSKLFVEADQQYDADAADELFTLWKERKGVAERTTQTEKQVRRDEVRKASTGGARGAANTSPSSQKIYRRADIIRLMNSDPDRYEMLEPDIRQAYSEGRVR